MRILLIAYEFPPGRSPRALRWRYLVRELTLHGHEVHVLTPDKGDPELDFPAGAGSVDIHRVFAGPVAFLESRRRRAPTSTSRSAGCRTGTARLNWKGRLTASLKELADRLMFPDVRAEWTPWARAATDRLLVSLRPDVVVTSHEPASILPLGRYAKRRGFAWVADLGDPICAPYTPSRWYSRARALEASVVGEANLLLVPNDAAREELLRRHEGLADRCVVLSQGYDDRGEASCELLPLASDRLELLYAGRLYGFRDPSRLLEALSVVDGVRLTMVLGDPPAAGIIGNIDLGERLRIVGSLPHAEVLAMQRQADVLVSLGNRGLPVQVPGKLFEYLGTPKPILHIDTGTDDAAARILDRLHRGWLCTDETGAISSLLRDLRQKKLSGRLTDGLQLAPESAYAISVLGRRLSDLLTKVVEQALSAETH